MEHITEIDSTITIQLEPLFRKISEGKVILFLGAGSSVSENMRFLSNDIITYYEDHIHKALGITDLTEFVDVLSSQKDFSRIEFDDYVYQLLNKLEVTKAHEVLASIPWRYIITTNYDLLVEKAFFNVKNTPSELYDIVPIRSSSELNQYLTTSQIKYVKLNGCMSDRKAYPFVFSTEDFKRVKPFYNKVLNELKSVSDDIWFLSLGYSYNDPFAKNLLTKFDSYDFRNSRILHTIDPYISDFRLDFLTNNRIRVIKLSFNDFMKLYNDWITENANSIVKTKDLYYFTKENIRISLPPQLVLNLSSSLVQLNEYYKSRYYPAESFYRGEEPDFSVILRNYDVIREEPLNRIMKNFNDNIKLISSNLIPIFFFVGDFGSGKSTFTYRFINRLNNQSDACYMSFEVTDPLHLEVKNVKELLKAVNNSDIIIYFNFIERDSFFTSLLEFRNKLSTEQLNGRKIIIICSIRDNLLKRYKHAKDIKNTIEFNIDFELNDNEINDLLLKLRNANIITFRDEREKLSLLNKIKKEYKGDSYLTLLDLVNGNHFKDLIEAYKSLPPIAQRATLYISLLHQYNILMPIGILKELVSKDWDHFRNELLDIDCKGILIQEPVTIRGTYPDYLFKTKHKIIAKTLIDYLIPNPDDQFSQLLHIINKVHHNEANSRLVNDLLKYLRENNIFNTDKINKLYDLCSQQLPEDPYFLLIYCTNLQHRHDLKSLEKALKCIIYADSLLEKRNHRFVHRRAVINFELAKYHFLTEGDNLIITTKYLREAEELFKIKLLLDPFSFYSYFNYLEFLIWLINNIILKDEDILRRRIQIDELFESAETHVFEGINRILELKAKFIHNYQGDSEQYFNILKEYYEKESVRPLALILLYNYYLQNNLEDNRINLIPEIEYYIYNEDIRRFLFRFYGNNLHVLDYRLRFFELNNKSEEFLKSDSLRYNYFMFIANCYNHYFNEAWKFQSNIKHSYEIIHPDFNQVWKDEDGQDLLFDGIIIKNKEHFVVRIIEMQRTFRITNWKNLVENSKVKVKLHFFFNGIRASISSVEH